MNALRILVVEDEILVARDLKATLTKQGFEVTGVCRTGEEALEAVRRDRPEVVLMDIQLGSAMDGVETASRLQSEASLPIVFLTGHSDEETLLRARSAQPYGYLLKPFHESEVRSAVELAHARHESHAALQACGDRLISTLHSLAEGVISTNLLGVINFMNPVAEAITGWTLREAGGRPLREVFRVALPNGEPLEASGLMMSGAGPVPRTILLTDRNGRTVHIEDSTTPIRDAEGSLAGIVILFRRRNAPSSLEPYLSPDGPLPESLTSLPWPDLSGIVSSISDPLLAVDADWRITWLNPLASEALGGDREDLMGRVLWDCLPPSLHRRYYHEFSSALTRRMACSFEMEHEARGLWFGVQLYPFEGGLLALLRDITAERRAEEERSKLEKLENLGLLARGFAHDFNNLLTVLLGNLSLVESQVAAAGDPLAPRGELRTAMRATVQAQNLVQQLLIFARGGAPIRQLTDPGRLVREWFAEWPGRADVEYRLAAPLDTWQVEWDRHQIRRILANLVKNAEQALTGEARRITITLKQSARGLSGEGSMAAGAGNAAESWLVLEIADAGTGMEAGVLAHAPEPYFTTREESNATGLGLTVCESITKAHGGTLRIFSHPGEGTKVRAIFPLPANGAPPLDGSGVPAGRGVIGAVPAASPPMAERPYEIHETYRPNAGFHGGSASGGSGPAAATLAPLVQQSRRRVLILEDEPLIRQLLLRHLEAIDCEVTATAEGSETVRVYLENLRAGHPFDLLIVDLSIPGGMGGAPAMEKIRQMDPGVRAIVSSGYSDDPVMSRPADYGFRAVLPKPWQPRDLHSAVNGLLPPPRLTSRVPAR
ncbi:MAG: response regulator [Verrucomicrobiota bacterium]